MKAKAGLHFTTKHTGKMTGMVSISTSCQLNERCKRNAQVPGSVCSKCYAQRQMKMFKTMQPVMENNTVMLSSRIMADDEIPLLNYAFVRIESFGDLVNTTHAINYLKLIRKNPQTFFAWWTKNPDFIAKAFKKTGYEKPANLNIIRSSMMINKQVKPGYWFIDGVFTAYTKEYAKENNVEINCGTRKCFECRREYTKHDGIIYTNELLK